ncbi:nucleotidyl transferase AbiEii/AbiGii toxin family protein [Actinomadura syzygii]|uniref:Nucleotidyl transferase AbiEii/AbiGii toxin family protein n=1 Tax=Actinomadura syzygii TaxID=1427538 RepID=A0A5D0U9K1_9ACTN|nr:nucleotidyl transferase AbiEii/AbiGii toxin family protein [Actinomadura syzygii]TYC13739.1 nucleotidyl transferase AbiEii/AbiGii toxin family protein [Actinomadura syzygii]
MRRYANAVDLRRALEARLKQRADETGTDLGRLRRVAVFDRIAARLSAAERRWILKGGTSLEFRLGGRARATKDLDLALPDGPTYDGEALREELIETLALDVDGDGFAYSVKPPTPLEPDAAGRPGWRFSVDSRLAGKSFAVVVERQHFAEKLHALTRDYGSRPNTRVKDLVDIVLLIEDGLTADKPLLDVVNHVFAVRATHPVPTAILDPPPVWAKDYPMLAEDLTLADPDLTTALDLLRKFWAQALTTETET